MTNLGALINAYLDGRVRRGEITPASSATLRSRLASLQRSAGDGPLDRAALLAWSESLEVRRSTRREYLSTLKGFCRWLVAEGHLDVDPTVHLAAVREPTREPRALEETEVARLLAMAPNVKWRAVLVLMVQCGLRCVEVSRLDLADWNQTRSSLFVRGKACNERTVAVPAVAAMALRVWVAERGGQAGPLFPGQRHGRLSRRWCSQMISGLFAKAGLKSHAYDGRSAHSLRHTCASDVLEHSRDIRAVQRMLGHQSLTSTEIYLRNADLDRMATAMEGRAYGQVA